MKDRTTVAKKAVGTAVNNNDNKLYNGKHLWELSKEEKVKMVQERAQKVNTASECRELLNIIYPFRYEMDISSLIKSLEDKRDSLG